MPTNLSLYSAEGERGSWLLKILDTELEFFPILLSQLTISGDLHSFECALVHFPVSSALLFSTVFFSISCRCQMFVSRRKVEHIYYPIMPFLTALCDNFRMIQQDDYRVTITQNNLFLLLIKFSFGDMQLDRVETERLYNI